MVFLFINQFSVHSPEHLIKTFDDGTNECLAESVGCKNMFFFLYSIEIRT